MNFLNKILSALKAHPERQAFCIQDRFYTYTELFAIVAGIQSQINDTCPGEQNIGIIISDDIETYASILALMFAGKTYIPIHPDYPAERAGQILEQAKIKYLLSKADKTYAGAKTIVTDGAASAVSMSSMPQFEFSTTNAYILFTSGSTGVPKGVPITYCNLDSFIDAFHALGYNATEQDRFLQMFELTFDLSVMSYLAPLCYGACVYTIPDSGMKFMSIYSVLEKHNITFALMVPSVLANLRPYFEEIDLQAMRVSLFCGEALYKDVVTEWMKCVPNAQVENVYGPTEATIFCLTYKVSGTANITDYNGIVAIGAPMQGMGSIVVDEHNKPLPDGEKGELCLSGNQLTPGYLDPEKTKQAFFELDGTRYYRTGDVSFRNADGDYIYCGRADHQVKIQGFRVELNEIEFHLRAITGSSNVVALAMNSANGLTQIDVVFEGAKTDTDPVIETLKTKVPPYMLPAQIHFVATFPLNTSGKTDRKALQKMIS